MPRKKKDRHDIVAEILEIARNGILRTQLMQKARLNHVQLNKYLSSLLDKGYLENHTVQKQGQVKHILKTTDRGERLLENIKALNLLWSSPTSKASRNEEPKA